MNFEIFKKTIQVGSEMNLNKPSMQASKLITFFSLCKNIIGNKEDNIIFVLMELKKNQF